MRRYLAWRAAQRSSDCASWRDTVRSVATSAPTSALGPPPRPLPSTVDFPYRVGTRVRLSARDRRRPLVSTMRSTLGVSFLIARARPVRNALVQRLPVIALAVSASDKDSPSPCAGAGADSQHASSCRGTRCPNAGWRAGPRQSGPELADVRRDELGPGSRSMIIWLRVGGAGTSSQLM
jgi:hypothetical protein